MNMRANMPGNTRLPGFMNYGPSAALEMSVAPEMAVNPDLAALSPMNYTGDNGMTANLGALSPMAYGMSPAGSEITANMPAVVDPQAGGGIFGGLFGNITKQDIFGGTDAMGNKTLGAANVGLGAIQGAANLYMGMQQYGLAKKQLAEGKRRFDLEYGAQKQTTNTRLEDRQRARVASNSGAYESVGTYMNKNGIK